MQETTCCARRSGKHTFPHRPREEVFPMRRFLLLLIALSLLLPLPALAETISIGALAPIEMPAEESAQVLDLYCGPTQGFYRHENQTLDTGKPYVIFGQYDCWAMAAQGTSDSFGPIGWVEAGSITGLPYEPQLAFEDGFAAVVEEIAAATDNPLSGDPFAGWTIAFDQGAEITVLAQLGDWIYVQGEFEDIPARVFIKADTMF